MSALDESRMRELAVRSLACAAQTQMLDYNHAEGASGIIFVTKLR
jgi:hypothetical protein